MEAQEVDRLGEARATWPAAGRRPTRAPAADQQVDRPGSARLPGPERLEERLQPLEREVMADEQADQVGRLQSQPVAERAAHGAGLGDLHPVGIDGVGHDVDQLPRDVVELLEVPPDHVADGDHPGLPLRGILPVARSPGRWRTGG